MGDDTRPPGIDLVPPALRAQIAEVIDAAEQLRREVELLAQKTNDVAVEVESCLAGLDDDEHWDVAEIVGLRKLLTLVDLVSGGA